MTNEPMKNDTKQLGSILLTIGWILCIVVISFLYNKSLYSIKDPNIIVGRSEVKITVQKSFDGHYYLKGQIGSQPTDLLIDTGATKLSLSENLAKKLNLPFGEIIQTSTANGNTDGYLTRIPSLIIASIEFNNVSAIIMPNMSNEILMGMNLLKNFDMLQQDDILTLTYKMPKRGIEPPTY